MPLNLTAIQGLRKQILDATAEAATETILAKSNQYIPKDTDTAEESGRVVIDGDRIVITYGRDDDANPKTGQPTNSYVEHLHEDMEAHHAAGTGAQFLKRAADEMGPGMDADIAKRVNL